MDETRTITTPEAGIEVVLKTQLTGADDEAIEAALLASTVVAGDTDGADARIGGEAVIAARHAALRQLVVSVAGDKTDVLAKLLALPRRDYKFVVAEIDKITEADLAKKD